MTLLAEDDFRRYVETRIAEPTRPPDADVIYADGYEAGIRAAFRDVLFALNGDTRWRLWLEG